MISLCKYLPVTPDLCCRDNLPQRTKNPISSNLQSLICSTAWHSNPTWSFLTILCSSYVAILIKGAQIIKKISPYYRDGNTEVFVASSVSQHRDRFRRRTLVFVLGCCNVHLSLLSKRNKTISMKTGEDRIIL